MEVTEAEVDELLASYGRRTAKDTQRMLARRILVDEKRAAAARRDDA